MQTFKKWDNSPSKSYVTEYMRWYESVSELTCLYYWSKLVIAEVIQFFGSPSDYIAFARTEDLSLLPSYFQDLCSSRVFEEGGKVWQRLLFLPAGENTSLDWFYILTPYSIPPTIYLNIQKQNWEKIAKNLRRLWTLKQYGRSQEARSS